MNLLRILQLVISMPPNWVFNYGALANRVTYVVNPQIPIIVTYMVPNPNGQGGPQGDVQAVIIGNQVFFEPSVNDFSSCYNGNDCSALQAEGLDLSFLGYPYFITGGGCISGSGSCPPTPNPSGVETCNLIINKETGEITQLFGGALSNTLSVMADTNNGYLIIVTSTNSTSADFIIAIPFSSITSILAGKIPPDAKWVIVSTSDGSSLYANQAELIDGNIYFVSNTGNGVEVFKFPLSEVYNSQCTGIPQGYSSCTYTVNPLTSISQPVANSGGNILTDAIKMNGVSYLIIFYPSNGNFTVILYNTEDNTYSINTFGQNIEPQFITTGIAIYNHIVLATAQQLDGTWLLYAYDPFNGKVDSTTIPNVYQAVPTDNGYVVTLSNTLSSNSQVTISIYKVLFTISPKFQNVSITKTLNQVTVQGTLIDENSGNPLPNYPVMLVAVNGVEVNTVTDFTVLATGTTDSNGNFTLTTSDTSHSFYGVVYYPS